MSPRFARRSTGPSRDGGQGRGRERRRPDLDDRSSSYGRRDNDYRNSDDGKFLDRSRGKRFDRKRLDRDFIDHERQIREREKRSRSNKFPLRGKANGRFDKENSQTRLRENINYPPNISSNRQGVPEAAAAKPPPDDLIWGRHSSQAALESGRPIHRIWCTPEIRSASKFLQLLRDAKASGVLVEEVSWARLGHITGGSVHQGIAMQTAASDTLDLDLLIEGCADLGESPVLLALDGVTDPQNLGAVVRSAEAMGAQGVILPQRRSAGLTGSVAKVAAGALEHIPVARVVNLNRSLEKLKVAGYRVIGLAEEGDVTITDVDLDGPLVLVTGSEENGLSLLTRRHCDQLVRIPLRGVTPSLNVSVATAICVYEIARRNWMSDIHGQAPSPPIKRARTGGARSNDLVDQPNPTKEYAERIELNLTSPEVNSEIYFDESIQFLS